MSSNGETPAGVVIVGVDGSDASKDALRWALRYARRAGATVHAVTAWQYPPSYSWAPAILDQADLEGDARRMLKQTIEEIASSYPDVAVRSEVIHGSAAVSIIPTTTGAARAASLVIPELQGRLDGIALRVPVEDGSLTDLAVVLGRPASAEEINAAFEAAAAGPLEGILRYTTDPIVSRDIIGDPNSCIFDAGLTQASGTLAKVFGWYDNEWGFTNRLVELSLLVAGQLP